MKIKDLVLLAIKENPGIIQADIKSYVAKRLNKTVNTPTYTILLMNEGKIEREPVVVNKQITHKFWIAGEKDSDIDDVTVEDRNWETALGTPIATRVVRPDGSSSVHEPWTPSLQLGDGFKIEPLCTFTQQPVAMSKIETAAWSAAYKAGIDGEQFISMLVDGGLDDLLSAPKESAEKKAAPCLSASQRLALENAIMITAKRGFVETAKGLVELLAGISASE